MSHTVCVFTGTRADYGLLKPLMERLRRDERFRLRLLVSGSHLSVDHGLTVSEIRQYCPHAVIHGQLAPFTLSRCEHANIVAEFLRDFEQAKEKRGLFFTTAGSINNGTSLQSIRLVMSIIQHYGRY